ncbi:MAG: cysteine synthase A [Myxococcota bacterium]|nr:cysteine synthase A [Myxococcota bacterium]
MGRIYDDITQTIGQTPLIRLNRLTQSLDATVLVKCEFFNPLSSIKDRIGLAMIEQAEASGQLNGSSVLIEPTSGNTGIALAFVCAVKGYKLILTMPESMSEERRALLKGLGADIELTPAAAGMQGAVTRAYELANKIPGALVLQQFNNAAGPAAHENSTAVEIWNDCDGQLDAFVSGVGTGGTITGTGRALKTRNPSIHIVGVEPSTSQVINGRRPGPHNIQGIGAGFIPDNLDKSVLDEVIAITDEEAYETARKMAKLEGIPAGISSGATCCAALKLARRKDFAGKTIVAIVASAAERYLSTPLYRELIT